MIKIKINKLKDMSIFFKLSFCFGSIILLVIILSYVDFSYYKSDKESSTIDVVNQMNLQATSEIDGYIENLFSLTKTPLFYDSDNTNILKILQDSNSSADSSWTIQNNFSKMLESIFSLNKQVHSIFIFNLRGQNINRITNNSLPQNYDVVNKPWFTQSISNFGKPLIIPTFQLLNLGESNVKSPYVFGVARGLVRWDSSRVVGVIQINSNIDVVSNMLKKLLIYPGQRVIITDDTGYIMCDTIEKNITSVLDTKTFSETIKNFHTIGDKKIDGVQSLISSETSSITGWKIINIIPTNALNNNINTMKNRTYFLTLAFVLLAFIFIIIISRQILTPINRISKVMKIVEKGDFDVKVKVESNDELGHLSATFNTMTKRIKYLINEVYVDKIHNKDLELQMLQNQINPHFIYNTLESIHMMAEINNDKETSKMAYSLGNIIRYSLSRKNNLVSVADEIKNLEAYILLQEIRMDNIENFIIDVDKGLLNHTIIKLILQPLVENAIYHGMDSVEDGGEIKILGYSSNSSMIFEVIDNGQGMDQDKCARLNAYINDLNEDFTSVGLRNVNMRIKLHYSNKYGVEIFSEEGVGTKVKIVIPFKPINSIE